MTPDPPEEPSSTDDSGESSGRESHPLLGEVVAGRYRILSLLGEGAMGAVFLAEHLRMGRRDAVKVLDRSVVDDDDARARFTREARNASTINHPNVCTVYDFGEILDGLPFIAMEYVEGETLSSLLEREGPLSPDRAVRIASQVCEALDAAHRREIIHRDLKPDNIMLTRDARGEEVVKVVDFGIAKAMTEDAGQDVTRAGWVVGTPEYVSPEQLEGLEMDGRSDLYSLGIVLFRMLTGRLPFTGGNWQEVMTRRLSEDPARLRDVAGERIPRALDRAVDRVLRTDREERQPDAERFRRDLESAVAARGGIRPATAPPTAEVPGASAPQAEEPSPPPEPSAGPAIPWKRLALGAGGIAGIALLIAAGSALLGGGESGTEGEGGSEPPPGAGVEDTTVQGGTGASGEPTPVAIRLSLSDTVIRQGERASGRAVVLDSQGNSLDRSVDWRSSDRGVASIGADGSVVGRSAGRVQIVASTGQLTSSATLTVEDTSRAEPSVPPQDSARSILARYVGESVGAGPGDAERLQSMAGTGRRFYGTEQYSPEVRGLAAYLVGRTFLSRADTSSACRWLDRAVQMHPDNRGAQKTLESIGCDRR